jgi:D-glycero-alpha-D-manno-heptose-7-phosphate kinase
MRVTCQAPVRVDLAGAWTDVVFFYEPFGGATLNAAIAHYVYGELLVGKDAPSGEGVHIRYYTEVPTGSGLGTSAAMNVVWLALVKAEPVTTQEARQSIAEGAYQAEKILGIIGGKQDQYAAAFGGINLFEFRNDGVTVNPVRIPPEKLSELEKLFVLCYTGASRLSSRIHENVWGRFGRGNREVIDALLTMRDSAYECKAALERGDWKRVGEILSLQFECSKRLDASTSNETIERLFDLVKDEILGGKPCGAGGGGCVLFLCKDEAAKWRVEQKLLEAKMTLLPFRFDFNGLTVKIEP